MVDITSGIALGVTHGKQQTIHGYMHSVIRYCVSSVVESSHLERFT